MIALFVLLAALAFVSVHAAHDSVDGCKAESAIDDATFKSLLSSIGATPFSSNKQKIVEQFVAANLTHGFAGPQTLALLQALDFTSSKTQLIRTIKPWVLGMTCDEMTALLGAQTFSSGKMDTLKDLVDFVIDLPDNNATIISAFTFSSDQKKAQKLIDDATPISCLFGDPNQRKHMVFVIDYSGSMSTTMKDPAGNTVTRLQFVQSQLQFVLEKSLHKSQFLNIIAFSDAASAWSPGVVSATDANVASAVAFVNKLRPYRGTNMLAALQLAVSDSAVEGIVLLSDGEPNGGRAQMISLAQSWRTQDRIINTVLLEAGGPAQSGAAAFLCSLANAGGGVCRTNN